MSFWDIGSDGVHEVSPDGTVSGISGSLSDYSSGLDVDSAGNIYSAGSFYVWKLDPQGGLTTLPFNEEATDVAVDRAGNLFVADFKGSRILMLSPAGIVTTVAGNGTEGFSGDGGPATSAQLNHPISIAVDKLGNILVGDSGNLRIRKITRWIDYYYISGMPYNGEDISFWFNFADNVWYSGNRAGEISLVGAHPPWEHCYASLLKNLAALVTPTDV